MYVHTCIMVYSIMAYHIIRIISYHTTLDTILYYIISYYIKCVTLCYNRVV